MMDKEDLKFFEEKVGSLDGGFGYDYNVFAASEGVKIAKSLLSKDEIIRFSKLNWDEQKGLVPTIDDGHSGNTFDMACRFAILYLEKIKIDNRDEKIETITNV